MNRTFRIAMVCGLVPLVLGTSIFLLWLLTRWDWLVVAGIGMLWVGGAMVLVGLGALFRYCLQAQAERVPGRRLLMMVAGCGVLLLGNVFAAGVIVVAVVGIETCYTVVVHNATADPLEDVTVFGGGCDEMLGHIAAGQEGSRSFWIQRDGELKFRALRGSTMHATTIDEYVTGNLGGHATVRVNDDGTLTVTHQ